MFKWLTITLLINLSLVSFAGTSSNGDRICGKWMSSEKNLMVQVYHDTDNTFKAKIIWFSDDPSKPMGEWCDTKNPNPALRTRKILGMDVLRDFRYHSDGGTWEDGMIYDAQHGREWNGSAYIDKDGSLKVKGYWHFKVFGRTMTFKRV